VEHIENYGDERQLAWCIHCGGSTETKDHVPSRVFLDEPYPEYLPVVPCCEPCNKSFSLDEEYLACLIECVIAGSVEQGKIRREKIRRTLQHTPALAARLNQARNVQDDGIVFNIEHERVRNVVLKLARGHVAYELNEPQREEPSSVIFVPLVSLTDETREDFESPPTPSLCGWPEVGSRAMQNLVLPGPEEFPWVVVQPGRYRYLTSVDDGVVVRIVIGEYLGCDVIWDGE